MAAKQGFVYIFTNQAFPDMIKIGYTKNVEARRKQLNTSGVPGKFEIYATCESSFELIDRKLHKLIDILNPDLRYSEDREFYLLSPEDGYAALEVLVEMIEALDNLKRYKKDVRNKATINESKPEKILYELKSNIFLKDTENPLPTARFLSHLEAQLIEEGFKGNKGIEIARRLGFDGDNNQRKKVYEYLEFSRLIPLIQKLAINEGKRRSNFLRIAKYDLVYQKAIYDILIDAKKDNVTLTRANVKKICDRFKEGCRSWNEIKFS
ncbi:MAG: GIY-YIG nuclease family protein [Lachnospiraceae bacterium]|nr:GIY-YIG nuclease family protein [Lachnospiraceae bacterium]